MKSRQARDRRRRNKVAQKEEKRLLLAYLIKNESVSQFIRSQAQLSLNRLPKDSSSVRVHNRCVLTDRSKGVLSDFRLSRIVFRDQALKAQLPGIGKASW